MNESQPEVPMQGSLCGRLRVALKCVSCHKYFIIFQPLVSTMNNSFLLESDLYTWKTYILFCVFLNKKES